MKDLRMNLFELRGNDMIDARIEQTNSNFSVIISIIQFYANEHNFQFDNWIKLKFYEESPNIIFYLKLKF